MGDMDSGNSGSIQSSSSGGGGGGDDQEYDSCHGGGAGVATESISAFLNSYNAVNMGSSSNTPTVAHQLYSFSNNNLHQVGVSNSFSYPNFFNNNNNNNNGNNNNGNGNGNSNINDQDMVWPNKFPSIRPCISTDDTNCTEGHLPYSNPNNHQQQSPTSLPLQAHGPPAPSSVSSPRSGPGRNPKKRSRASRRAPTTVLTTDTTNFRQMVQEFTGIPDPPFTGFSPGTRYHLFTGLGSGHSNNSSVVQLQPQSYLLRPLHQPQFLGNSTNNNISIMNDTLGLAAVSSSAQPLTTFQLCDPQDYLSNTNPQLNFQSFQQSSGSGSGSGLGSSLAMNEKYSSLPALIQQDSSMGLGCARVNNSTAEISCSVNNPAGGSYLDIVNTTNDNTVAANGGLDNIGRVTKGNEGMMDSWICSSD